MLSAANDPAGAQDVEQVALDAVSAMAAAEPAVPKWRVYVAIGEMKVGEYEAAQGRHEDALKLYRASLAIREPLAKEMPDDGELKRATSALHRDIGDVLLGRDDFASALTAYEAALAIDRSLVGTDPKNAQWQRELSISYGKVGFAEKALGRMSEARDAYAAGRAIAADQRFQDDVAMFDDEIAALPK